MNGAASKPAGLRLAAVAALFLLLLSSGGCGRKAKPDPRSERTGRPTQTT